MTNKGYGPKGQYPKEYPSNKKEETIDKQNYPWMYGLLKRKEN